MSKILEVRELRVLLPFVRSIYAEPSKYIWEDGDGTRHVISQCEGGEQGDPLMPLLFCMAVHYALVEVTRRLQEDEHVFAFLDDVYALTPPDHTRDTYELLGDKLKSMAGIEVHSGRQEHGTSLVRVHPTGGPWRGGVEPERC